MPETQTAVHRLVFTDREARPATWTTTCGAQVPLEETTSVEGNITCDGCAFPPGKCLGCDKPATEGSWCQQCIYEANIMQAGTPDQQVVMIGALVEFVEARERARWLEHPALADLPKSPDMGADPGDWAEYAGGLFARLMVLRTDLAELEGTNTDV